MLEAGAAKIVTAAIMEIIASVDLQKANVDAGLMLVMTGAELGHEPLAVGSQQGMNVRSAFFWSVERQESYPTPRAVLQRLYPEYLD